MFRLLCAVSFLVLATARCGVGEELEAGEAALSSSSQALTIAPGDTECAARKVAEFLDTSSGGPLLPVSCQNHEVNVYKAQFIVVTERDPNSGALYRTVVPDYRNPSQQICSGSTCTTYAQPLMVEVTCGSQAFFECPCGVAEETISGTLRKGARCRSTRNVLTPSFP